MDIVISYVTYVRTSLRNALREVDYFLLSDRLKLQVTLTAMADDITLIGPALCTYESKAVLFLVTTLLLQSQVAGGRKRGGAAPSLSDRVFRLVDAVAWRSRYYQGIEGWDSLTIGMLWIMLCRCFCVFSRCRSETFIGSRVYFRPRYDDGTAVLLFNLLGDASICRA